MEVAKAYHHYTSFFPIFLTHLRNIRSVLLKNIYIYTHISYSTLSNANNVISSTSTGDFTSACLFARMNPALHAKSTHHQGRSTEAFSVKVKE